MFSRLRAINNHLPQLEATIERLVTAITKECLTKNIITRQVYQSLLRSSKSKKEKVKSLIRHVWKTIREDKNKCEQFIQILERHKSCNDLVTKIRKDQEEFENNPVVAGEKQNVSGTLVLSGPGRQHRTRPPRPCSSVQCTESQVSPTLPQCHPRIVRPPGPCSSVQCTESQVPPTLPQCHQRTIKSCHTYSDDQYNLQMETAQQEAQLLTAQDEKEKLKAEKRKLQEEKDLIERKRSELERELRLKDKELDKMTKERDDLNDSEDLLKQKVSRAEKKNYVDRKTLKKLVTEREEKIEKLQREKDSLDDAFKASDKRYQELQQKVAALEEGIAKRCEDMIDQLKDKLAERQQSSCTSYCCRVKQVQCNMCKVPIIITIFILLVGYAMTRTIQ